MTLSPAGNAFTRRVTHPILFRLWLLLKLPSALFAGVGIKRIGTDGCETTVPFGWRSQNPFQSTYFATQAMAAELSTGALVLLATTDAGVPLSTLIVEMRATFGKKATATTTFSCVSGAEIFAAVAQARASGEARVIVVETVGRLPDGAEASRFWFTWSVKARRTGA
ncbi:MAG: thioesterase [Myxococcales bacterium]|nr:thioesterase [Myxococcales bacterium]